MVVNIAPTKNAQWLKENKLLSLFIAQFFANSYQSQKPVVIKPNILLLKEVNVFLLATLNEQIFVFKGRKLQTRLEYR